MKEELIKLLEEKITALGFDVYIGEGNEYLDFTLTNWGAEEEADYNVITDVADALKLKNDRFEIVYWYDISDFTYWREQLEYHDANYITCTITIDGVTSKDELDEIVSYVETSNETIINTIDMYGINERELIDRYINDDSN